jgi:SulP family sulfate permease
LVSGPVVALVPLALVVQHSHGSDGLLVCVVVAGLFLLVLGIGRLATTFDLIPSAAIAGLMSGLAVIALCGQVSSLIGDSSGELASGVMLDDCLAAFTRRGHFNATAAAMSLVTVGMILACRKAWPGLPTALILVSLVTAISQLLHLNVAPLPAPSTSLFALDIALPQIATSRISRLVLCAFGMAMVISIESRRVAMVASDLTTQQHMESRSLIAEGIANVSCAIIGRLPVSASLPASVGMEQRGATTLVAPLTYSAALLVAAWMLGWWPTPVPTSCLGAVLAVAAVDILATSGWRRRLCRPLPNLALFTSNLAIPVILGPAWGVPIAVAIGAVLGVRNSVLLARAGKRLRLFGGAKDSDSSHPLHEDVPRAGSSGDNAARNSED